MEYDIRIKEGNHRVRRENTNAWRYQFWDDVIIILKIVYGMKPHEIEKEVEASLKRVFPEHRSG